LCDKPVSDVAQTSSRVLPDHAATRGFNMKLSLTLFAANDAEPSGVTRKLPFFVQWCREMLFPLDITHPRFTHSRKAVGQPREALDATPGEATGTAATCKQRAAHWFHLPRWFRSDVHHVNNNF
jgi:hypothetical protein